MILSAPQIADKAWDHFIYLSRGATREVVWEAAQILVASLEGLLTEKEENNQHSDGE